VRDVLKTLGLTSWVKTTGGHGLHVVVPITRERDWSECLQFARDVSEALVKVDPIYTTTFAKRGRERKILIDYLRNNRTNTSVCVFSPRARAGAMVSTLLQLDGRVRLGNGIKVIVL
jgi:bifunctional non-homologous end joining protein LigD